MFQKLSEEHHAMQPPVQGNLLFALGNKLGMCLKTLLSWKIVMNSGLMARSVKQRRRELQLNFQKPKNKVMNPLLSLWLIQLISWCFFKIPYIFVCLKVSTAPLAIKSVLMPVTWPKYWPRCLNDRLSGVYKDSRREKVCSCLDTANSGLRSTRSVLSLW